MAYVVPQVLVFQDFNTVPTEITDPLRACVVGGHAKLVRYSESDEKILGALGAYDPTVDEDHDWPHRPAGGVVDQDYTKLFIDDALLLYFSDLLAAHSVISPVASTPNRITSNTVNFKTGNGFDRSALLFDRDVTPGDTVLLRGIVDSESVSLLTYVRRLLPEITDSSVGSATSETLNLATQVDGVAVTEIGDVSNCVSMDADASSYDGMPDGFVNDTYTMEVIAGSTGGDYTTAVVRVLSASGADDVAAFVPAAAGVLKECGSRGLQVVWDVLAPDASCSAEYPAAPVDLVAGQKWQVVVAGDFTKGYATAGGTYTGDTSTTYIVEVTRGGTLGSGIDADLPQVTVTTAHGTDVSGPTLVHAAASAITIGTQGLTMSFDDVTDSGTLPGLRKGDKYYVAVVAAADGRICVIELGHNLGTLVDATDMDLKLYIKKNIEVAQDRVGSAPIQNWTTDDTQIHVISGIEAFDATWTDSGEPLALPVEGGTVYVQYRAWLTTLTDGVGTLASVDDLDTLISGALSPDNPLKWAAYYAAINANGTNVKFLAVSDPADTEAWLEALALLTGRTDAYNLVPLTHNTVVLNAFAGHVTAESSAENGRWEGLFVGLQAVTAVAVANAALSTDGTVLLATLIDNPDATGTQYTILTVPAGNANFLTNGTQAGDIARFLFSTDGFGNTSYTEFVVDAVLSEDEIRLLKGHTVAITLPQKLEIWHNRSKDEIATAIAAAAGAYSDRRICAVWPDVITSGDITMDNYFLCAALAGLRSGVVPHQGLTNITLTGFDSVTRSTRFLNTNQLNTLAAAGVWVVTQASTGEVYTRHALTTDVSNLNDREEMIRANVDSISKFFLRRLAPFIGIINVTPSALPVIRVELESSIDFLKANGLTPLLGSQLIDGVVTELRQHVLLRDRLVAVLTLTVPAPLNNIELHLVI